MSQPKESKPVDLDLLGPLEEELDFFFSRFFGSPYPSIYRKELSWKPLTDFFETDKEFVLLMELAQIHPGDVSIQLQDGLLTVPSGDDTIKWISTTGLSSRKWPYPTMSTWRNSPQPITRDSWKSGCPNGNPNPARKSR